MNGHREISVVKMVERKEAVRWKEKEKDHRVELNNIRSKK